MRDHGGTEVLCQQWQGGGRGAVAARAWRGGCAGASRAGLKGAGRGLRRGAARRDPVISPVISGRLGAGKKGETDLARGPGLSARASCGANVRNGAPTGGVKCGRKGSARPRAARVGATHCGWQAGPAGQAEEGEHAGVLRGSGERGGLRETEEVDRAKKEQAGLMRRAGERELSRVRWALRKRRERERGLGSRKDWSELG